MYIFPINLCIVDINQYIVIENGQYLENMKATGVVVLTESAITFPLLGSW